MIVKMKKVFLIVQQKDAAFALERLADAESVHVDHVRSPSGGQIQELKNEIDHLNRILELLPHSTEIGDIAKEKDWKKKVDVVPALNERIQQLKENVMKRQNVINQWEPWGDFSPDDIRFLESQGVYLQLCQIPIKKMAEGFEGVTFEKISIRKKMVLCLAVSSQKVNLPFEVLSLPEKGLKQLYDLQEQDQAEIEEATKGIQSLGRFKSVIKDTVDERKERLCFEEALWGMGEQDSLVYLKGFCPVSQVGDLEKIAQKNSWGILFEDPSEEDPVPTLLQNHKWAELSKPAFDMIEILPGYRELDVSPVFIIFFTLFFGMLIGDAGYGLIFVSGVFFLQKKFKDTIKNQLPFYLLYLLTGFTVLWGILTGTYFGQEWLPSSVNAVVPWLNEKANVQWLCFTIALTHLSIARFWKFITKLPSLTALAEIGWLLIIWGMYFLSNMFVLNQPLPGFVLWLFSIGISLALFFMVPLKDFLRKVPQELIPFALGVVGAGTDIISYIRLFAVGLATVAVADAANFMPQALPFGVGYVFLLLLHTINIILALMAILVHAIRLNLLEFSGHLGLEWSGFKYSPLKKFKQVLIN